MVISGSRIVWNTLPLCLVLLAVGCASAPPCSMEDEMQRIGQSEIPRELSKMALPVYKVEPPDILLIEAVNNIRLPDYQLRAGDVVTLRLANPEPLEPVEQDLNPLETQFRIQTEAENKIIDGEYKVQPDGTVNLGPIYGKAPVAGMTLEEAKKALEQHLQSYTRDAKGNPVGIKEPKISITMDDIAGKQLIAGEHLVRPDGTLSLGIYGQVYVAGMTLECVKKVVEQHLTQFIQQPEVNVDVLAYNSKVFYVITDGAGFGEQVQRLPVTGNETVLDAISQINGLSAISSKRIWISRPAPAGTDYAQVMDVDWRAITAEGLTATNYQIFPGDRIYIEADPWVKVDNAIARVTAPLERLAGSVLLGTGLTRSFQYLSFGLANDSRVVAASAAADGRWRSASSKPSFHQNWNEPAFQPEISNRQFPATDPWQEILMKFSHRFGLARTGPASQHAPPCELPGHLLDAALQREHRLWSVGGIDGRNAQLPEMPMPHLPARRMQRVHSAVFWADVG